jgi:hypothetical protein
MVKLGENALRMVQCVSPCIITVRRCYSCQQFRNASIQVACTSPRTFVAAAAAYCCLNVSFIYRSATNPANLSQDWHQDCVVGLHLDLEVARLARWIHPTILDLSILTW